MRCCISFCSKELISFEKHLNDENICHELGINKNESFLCLDCYDLLVMQQVNASHLELLKSNARNEYERSTLFYRKLVDLQREKGNFTF
jgi:hypothetical protein